MIRDLRPQLSDEQASEFSPDKVLRLTGLAGNERVDPWEPWVDDFMAGRAEGAATYTVKNGGALQHTINRAVTACAGPDRIFIALEPGVYDGPFYIPALKWQGCSVPITLYGLDRDPTKTVLRANIDAEMSGKEYRDRFAGRFAGHDPQITQIFETIAGRDKITTAHASVLRVENDECQLRNLTLLNTYNADRTPEGSDLVGGTHASFQQSTGQHQAVALLVAGADRVHGENLHLESFQDTLYLKSPALFTTARSYFKDCRIAGDVDFIFGQTTAYFTGCAIISRGVRALQSWVTAPSTNLRTPFGFVFDDCLFAHDNSLNAHTGLFSLGRQWFEAVRATPYCAAPDPAYRCDMGPVSAYNHPTGAISRATLEAVGKCVIMRSDIGTHINPAAPWDDWGGGSFDRAGIYTSGPWNPRFRPVQFTAADMTRLLGDWLHAQRVDLHDVRTDTIFLAEYKNQDVSDF